MYVTTGKCILSTSLVSAVDVDKMHLPTVTYNSIKNAFENTVINIAYVLLEQMLFQNDLKSTKFLNFPFLLKNGSFQF